MKQTMNVTEGDKYSYSIFVGCILEVYYRSLFLEIFIWNYILNLRAIYFGLIICDVLLSNFNPILFSRLVYIKKVVGTHPP